MIINQFSFSRRKKKTKKKERKKEKKNEGKDKKNKKREPAARSLPIFIIVMIVFNVLLGRIIWRRAS